MIERELMITDLSVVNDARANGPTGAWSFGGLMTNMAGTADVSRFIVNWLRTWESPQSVNSQIIAARPNIRSIVIDPWKQKDGQAGVSDDAWNVNLANAPFRLLAIVNRIDLRRGDSPVENAGEGRFVFGVLRPDGNTLPFTVIFEYHQIATDAPMLRGWARQWHELGTMSFGPDYNEGLQKITDRFAKKDAAPGAPNGSALSQLRTNEIALDFAKGWELREFVVGTGGFLEPATAKQSPANAFQNTAMLTKFIDENEAEILDRNFTIPASFDGQPFLAASSIVAPPTIGFFWQAPGVANPEARHIVAVTACNGCHHTETGTSNFLHVAPRAATQQAALSGFLIGDPTKPDGRLEVSDPVTGATHTFGDLAERAKILKDLAEQPGAVTLQALENSRRSRVH